MAEIHGFNDPRTQQEMQKLNAANFHPRLPRLHKPDYYIYLFSVAKRSFKVDHVFCKGELPGCKSGERYVLCRRLTEPAQQVAPDEANGGTRIYTDNGWRVAIDILNPNNPTSDPYWSDNGALGAFFGTSANSNLIAQGLFPSLNEVPTEEELQRAEKARDDRFRKLVDETLRLEGFSQRELQIFIQDNPDVHAAMDALGLEAPWHKRHEIKTKCPNCGDVVSDGVAFHKSSSGVLCVLNWKAAWEAGAVKKDDVPEPKRWWSEEAAPRGRRKEEPVSA